MKLWKKAFPPVPAELDCRDKNWTAAMRLTEAPSDDRERRERELQQANDFHRVLLAMAGHDLRQPLQIILSTYEWLPRRLETSSEREYLRRGRFAIARLNEPLNLLIEALRLHEHSANI
jgi:light-regulated signal transduction histidine kinase (bacteriophytochrome)